MSRGLGDVYKRQVVTSMEVNRRKRMKEVETIIRRENINNINRIVIRTGLIVVGDARLRLVINENGRIPL